MLVQQEAAVTLLYEDTACVKYVSLAHTSARIYSAGFVFLRTAGGRHQECGRSLRKQPPPGAASMGKNRSSYLFFLRMGLSSLDRAVCLSELVRLNLLERKGNFPQ